ncbi:hypothetical protein [Archangium sp.]|uniref:hypothetical protein n=1 Tax=Archangium sp. TaxID=1872627 RepID=UPI002D7288FA|nr:hypothetical protein [Archangium sp.]HYO52429.1 hypothetical protein [Archangium sp.]
MSFGIRLGHADCLRQLDVSDSTLTEAIQTVFPLEGHAVLEWDSLEFQLNYKYDLSMMMEDLLSLLRAVLSTGPGEREVNWPSSGFPYIWHISWSDPTLEVVASSRDEAGATRLPSPPVLRTTRREFLVAWQPLLRRILTGLETAGYREEHIAGMALLNDMSHATL